MRACCLRGLSLALVLSAASSLQAQISVTGSGAGPITFNAEPPLVVAEWATQDNILPGDAATYTTPGDVDAAAQLIAATSINTALARINAAGTARIARHNTNGTYIYTQPTGVPVTVLKATLRNNSGGDISAITVSYNYSIVATPVTDSCPGQRVFYSLTGATGSWQPIPALSGKTANALLTAGLNLGTWTSGSDLFIMWLDDNNQTGNDGGFAIDNFAVAIGLPPCPGITNQPQSVTVTQCLANATFSIGVTGAVTSLQWQRDDGLGGFTNIPSATANSYTLNPTVPGDNGSQFRAIIAGDGSCSETSSVATLTVVLDTAGPAPLFAYVTQGTNLFVYFNELIDTNTPAPGDVLGNYILTDTNTASVITILEAIPMANRLGYLLLLESPIDSSHGYEIFLSVTRDLCAGNSMTDTTIPVYTFISQPIALTKTWRYLDTDVDPGPNWILPAFDDSSWAAGPGPFDAKRNANYPVAPSNCRSNTLYGMQGPVPTCILLTSPVTLTNLITANFRTTFNFGGNTNAVLLEMSSKLDDGGIIYLNGVEIIRYGLPTTGVTRATLATRTVGDGEGRDVVLFHLPPSLLNGDNVLAVELHQQSLTSSDLTMGLELKAYTLEQLCSGGSVGISYNGTDVTITWTPGAVLQESTDISNPANWGNVSGSPTSGSLTIPAAGAAKFYRAVCP